MHAWIKQAALLMLVLLWGCHEAPLPSPDLESENPIVPPFAGGFHDTDAPQTSAAAGVPGHEHLDSTGAMAVITGYRERLKNNPTDLEALVVLANANYDIQRYAEAEPLYRRALAVDSENAFVRTDLATTLYRLGRAKEAVEELQRALAIDYKHESALYNLGAIKLAEFNDREGAIAAWEQLIDVTQDPQRAADLKARIAQLRSQPAKPKSSGSTSGSKAAGAGPPAKAPQ